MGKRKQAFCHTRAFWVFVMPALLLFSVFFILPLILSIGFSFTDYDGWKTMNFTGLQNYTKLLSSGEFYKTLGRTFGYALFSLPFKVIVPLLIAVLATTKYCKGITVVRTISYLPVLISALVVGITINWMFGQEYGLINFIIQSLGGEPLQWALNPMLATFVVSFASNWASTGFYMIMFIGGINNISKELYEASSVDGAKGYQTFFKITLPMIKDTIVITTLLRSIWTFNAVDLINTLTGGGPNNATMTMPLYIMQKFKLEYNYGYASALAAIASCIMMVVAFTYIKIGKLGKEEMY